jgi:DEAD/DEAH box helicase domain-containing protein
VFLTDACGPRPSTEESAINIVYFDLETQRTFDEVGGRGDLTKLGMAAAVTFNTAMDAYHRYTESRAKDLIQELQTADLVVGYNVIEFDYEVLRGYTHAPLKAMPTLDMMEHLARRLGFRPSLDSVATATLRVGKAGDGLQAVRWYRQGQVDKVLEYCQKDVELTKRLYEFGRQSRLVYYWDKAYQRQVVAVSW